MGGWSRAVVVLTVLQLSACAIMFSEKLDPQYEPSQTPTCGEAGTTLDGFLLAGYGLVSLIGIASGEGAVIAPGLIGAVGHSVSLFSGKEVARECADARAAHATYLDDQDSKIRNLSRQLRRRSGQESEDSDSSEDAETATGEPASNDGDLFMDPYGGRAQATEAATPAGEQAAAAEPTSTAANAPAQMPASATTPAAPVSAGRSAATRETRQDAFWAEVNP